MGNIIMVICGAFVVAMILIGLKRGMIKMAFSLVSIFVVLILINILTPSAKQLLKSTPVYTGIKSNIQEYVDSNVAAATESITQTGVSSQKKIIEGLPLPKEVKKELNKNNNERGYKVLKVDSFSSYIAKSLADMIIGAITFILLFIILSILVRALVKVLDIIAKLPVINAFNSIGGAIIGLAESVIVLWIACIVITAFSTTGWGQDICRAIASNGLLSFIYDNNLIQQVITGIFTV